MSFIRRDFVNNKRACKQMLMPSCNNTGPCYFPRFYTDYPRFKSDDKVLNANMDFMDAVCLEGVIYTLSARPMAVKEKRKLENRMKWVVIGEKEHMQHS